MKTYEIKNLIAENQKMIDNGTDKNRQIVIDLLNKLSQLDWKLLSRVVWFLDYAIDGKICVSTKVDGDLIAQCKTLGIAMIDRKGNDVI